LGTHITGASARSSFLVSKRFVKDIGLQSLSVGIRDDEEEPAEYLVARLWDRVSEALSLQYKDIKGDLYYRMMWAAGEREKLVWSDATDP
jgi:hypothetical protein